VGLALKLGVVFLVASVVSAIATRHHLWILVAGLAIIVTGVVVAAGFVAVALALGDGEAPAGSAFFVGPIYYSVAWMAGVGTGYLVRWSRTHRSE
jgi:hypothetical protein